MNEDGVNDEATNDGRERSSGMNANGAGLGLMIGVFGTWIIFDSLALGLLVGMVGMIIGGSTSKGAREDATASAAPETPAE